RSPADRIDDDVGAVAASGGADRVPQTVTQFKSAEIDGDVGPTFAGDFGVGRPEHAGDHLAGAERLGELHAGDADAAGSAEHEYVLARLDARSFDQRKMRGLIGEPERRAGGEFDALRHAKDI